MRPSSPPRHPQQSAPRVLIPMRSTQPRKRRYQHHAIRALHRSRQLLHLSRSSNHLQLIPQPLHYRASHQHAAFQRILHAIANLPRNRRQQPVLRGHRLRSRMHQHEGARAKRTLRHPRRCTHLSKQRRLLIPCNPRNRNPGKQSARRPAASTRSHYLRQHRPRNIQHPQQLLIPLQRMDVEEHRPRSVRHIGHMPLTLRQLPYQPAVHRPKRQLPSLRPFPRSVDMIQNPVDLTAREVSIRQQPSLCLNRIPIPTLTQSIAERRRPTILPHNRVIDRLTRLPIPNNSSLPLIRNSNRGDIVFRQISRSQRLCRHATLRSPYLRRRVLHPTRLRKYLFKWPLCNRNHRASLIHHHGPRTRSPLIQRQNVLSSRQISTPQFSTQD